MVGIDCCSNRLLRLGFGAVVAAVAAGRSFDSRNSSVAWCLEADVDLFSCLAGLDVVIVDCFARITRDTVKLAFDAEHTRAATAMDAFVDATWLHAGLVLVGRAAAFDHYQLLVITNVDKLDYLVNDCSPELDVASCVELA